MPELPEVETVKEGLVSVTQPPFIIKRLKVGEKQLRFPWPKGIEQNLKNWPVHGISRRAKYIIFQGDRFSLISHLGMTGTWRVGPDKLRKHDHIWITLSTGKTLVYNDPRRFGFVDIIEGKSIETSKWFSHLGPEPVGKHFNHQYFHEQLKKRNSTVKAAIMDQKLVVGVGNIYASEALFLSRIRPQKRANLLSKDQCSLLLKSIKSVIQRAIKAGGTTISDFKQVGGGEGYFSQKLFVYGKKNQACSRCGSTIKLVIIAGRSSFYCPLCQK